MSGLNQTFHEKVKLTLKDMPQLRAAPDESSLSYGDWLTTTDDYKEWLERKAAYEQLIKIGVYKMAKPRPEKFVTHQTENEGD